MGSGAVAIFEAAIARAEAERETHGLTAGMDWGVVVGTITAKELLAYVRKLESAAGETSVSSVEPRDETISRDLGHHVKELSFCLHVMVYCAEHAGMRDDIAVKNAKKALSDFDQYIRTAAAGARGLDGAGGQKQ